MCNVLIVILSVLVSLTELLPVSLKNKPSLEAFKAALKTNHDILDRMTFNRIQGTNKDILNYLY